MADEAYDWECPHCGRAVTISSDRRSVSSHRLIVDQPLGPVSLVSSFIVCPSPSCQKVTLQVDLFKCRLGYAGWDFGDELGTWRLLPASRAKVFPDYVPEGLRKDYQEACAIEELSPKASATLARRCLQAMLRHRWQARGRNLKAEIESVQEQFDSSTVASIEAVRQIGNIGAHMEKDVDLIIDVEPREARLLIQLLEDLFQTWYVDRHEREARTRGLVDAAAAKKGPKSEKSADS